MSRLFLGMCAVALGMGFAGAWHPVGDSLAVFRLPLAAFVGAIALVWLLQGRWRWMAVLILAGACASALSVIPFHAPVTPPQGGVRLYQKNLLAQPGDRPGLVEDIRASGADVVNLQEVSEAHMPLLEALKSDFPHQIVCRSPSIATVAVLSRWPARDSFCPDTSGLAAMYTGAPRMGQGWVVSIHQRWPWPWDQARRAEDIRAVLADLDGQIILAGDFNMVPWSHTMRRFADITNGQIVSTASATYWLAGLWPLRIDHVIAPWGGRRAETRPLFGADHHGVLAWLWWQP